MANLANIYCYHKRSPNSYACDIKAEDIIPYANEFKQITVIGDSRKEYINAYTPDNINLSTNDVHCYIAEFDGYRKLVCSKNLDNIFISEVEDVVGTGYTIKQRFGYNEEDVQKVIAFREL